MKIRMEFTIDVKSQKITIVNERIY